MAEARLVLGQSIPVAATLTAIYTVPASTDAIISTITACEQNGGATTIRISVAVAGAADATKQYIVFGAALQANETKAFTLGMTLTATDVVRVYSASGFVSFSAFGVQLT